MGLRMVDLTPVGRGVSVPGWRFLIEIRNRSAWTLCVPNSLLPAHASVSTTYGINVIARVL